MLQAVLFLSLCSLVRSSGVGHFAQVAPVAPIANAPVVTAASSQYFQRNFNRLVIPQPVAPVVPVVPPLLQPVFPAPPTPAVFVEPTRAVPLPPTPEVPVQPNVAIAVATAHAAAPVATILLPPYPFGFPPNIGFIPAEQPINVPDDSTKESTTPSTTQADATTTQEPEQTTPIPSNSDDNFVQALPSNNDLNFNQYGLPLPESGVQFQPSPSQQPNPQFQPQPQFPPQFPPQPQQPQPRPQQPRPQFQPQPPRPQFQNQQPRPQFNSVQQPQQPRPQFQPAMQPPRPRPQYLPPPKQRGKPQKLKTSVEVVPVPLEYITPPSPYKTHAHVKVVKHIYAYVPVTSSRIILRPIKVRSVPVRLVKHKSLDRSQNIRDIELTTLSSFPRPNTKPPRV